MSENKDGKPMFYDPTDRRIRSFVTRAGRLSTGQARALETLGPQFCIPFAKEPLDFTVFGRAAIQAYFTKDIAASHAAGVVFNLDPHTDVGVAGNTGWESGTYTATIKGTVVESGKFLSVSRKQGGKWHYLRDTWNVDAPPK